jgi:hypothetical protein
VQQKQAVEGFANACTDAASAARHAKGKTESEVVFVVVTANANPLAGLASFYRCALLRGGMSAAWIVPQHSAQCEGSIPAASAQGEG